MRTGLLALAVLGAALLAPACDVQVGDHGVSVDIAHGKATEEWARTYTLAPGGRLEIVNVNGPIDVTAATGSAVEVHATREARASSDDAARDLLRQTRIVEEASPARVRVELQGISSDRRSFGLTRVSVAYRVAIPKGLNASFHTENGPVRLDGVDGALDASTTSGPLTGRDLSGTLKASTVNGPVRIDIAAVRGVIDVRTVNGPVTLELPRSVDADLEATTVNGGVVVDDALSITTTDRGRTHVAGRLNGGGPKITAQTTNGPVRIGSRTR